MYYPQNNQLAGMKANRIDINGPNTHPKVWHLPNWKGGNDAQRVAVLRQIASESGRDPRFATLAVSILKAHKIEPRDYKAQANALLKWVQHNIYYVNEPSERLQDPMYTLKVGYGDCDDMAILLGTLYESIRLDWRFVLSGKVNGKLTRWIEGTPLPKNGRWSHIYLLVGYPPFQPKKWQFAEPTMRNVDLGWDIVGANGKLPEIDALGSVVAPEESKDIVKIVSKEEFAQIEKEKKQKEKSADRWQHLKTRLKPENLLTDVVISAVTAVLVSRFVDIIERKFFK